MDAPLDELYLNWLYGQIGSVRLRNRAKSHWSLARQLYSKEFVWIIPNDDNRVADGKDLRREFLEACEIDEVNPEWLNLGCSMLEMLIAFARVIAFEIEGNARAWFWHLIEQMDLEQYSDKHYDNAAKRKIDDALERVIWRRYEPNGQGGLFPLNHPEEDLTQVELWYQASAYLIEQRLL